MSNETAQQINNVTDTINGTVVNSFHTYDSEHHPSILLCCMVR